MKKMIRRIVKFFVKKHLKHYEKKNLKPFNTKVSIPEPEDYVYNVKTENLPTKHLIWNRPTVRHQQSIGSCASHAVIRAYEILLKYQHKDRYIEGSEMFHYYMARKYENETFPQDNGMTMMDAVKTLHKHGMGLEMLWPYDVVKYNTEPPYLTRVIAQIYKTRRYERIFLLDSIKQSLRENIPVVCGVWVDNNYYNLSRGNYLWKPLQKKLGGHAQIIIGYDDIEGVFILENSWGEDWGHNGTCKIKYEDFIKISFDWLRFLI
jgi:C1A family cysteine protease